MVEVFVKVNARILRAVMFVHVKIFLERELPTIITAVKKKTYADLMELMVDVRTFAFLLVKKTEIRVNVLQTYCLLSGKTAFCSCPAGFILGNDWKNCVDIDECAVDQTFKLDHRCSYECVNTIGSYKCVDEVAGDQQRSAHDYERSDENEEEFYNYENQERFDKSSNDFKQCFGGYFLNKTTGECEGETWIHDSFKILKTFVFRTSITRL